MFGGIGCMFGGRRGGTGGMKDSSVGVGIGGGGMRREVVAGGDVSVSEEEVGG